MKKQKSPKPPTPKEVVDYGQILAAEIKQKMIDALPGVVANLQRTARESAHSPVVSVSVGTKQTRRGITSVAYEDGTGEAWTTTPSERWLAEHSPPMHLDEQAGALLASAVRAGLIKYEMDKRARRRRWWRFWKK